MTREWNIPSSLLLIATFIREADRPWILRHRVSSRVGSIAGPCRFVRPGRIVGLSTAPCPLLPATLKGGRGEGPSHYPPSAASGSTVHQNASDLTKLDARLVFAQFRSPIVRSALE